MKSKNIDLLKPQHKRFLEAYLANGFHATNAAKSAGYKENSAGVMGSELLKRADIKLAMDEYFDTIRIENEELFNNLTNLLKSITNVTIDMYIKRFNADTKEITLKDIKRWTPAMRKACSALKYDKFGNIIVELHGKQWAADMIAKHIGFYGQEPNGNAAGVQNNVLFYIPDNNRSSTGIIKEIKENADD